jgi:hypothetical protein
MVGARELKWEGLNQVEMDFVQTNLSELSLQGTHSSLLTQIPVYKFAPFLEISWFGTK